MPTLIDKISSKTNIRNTYYSNKRVVESINISEKLVIKT